MKVKLINLVFEINKLYKFTFSNKSIKFKTNLVMPTLKRGLIKSTQFFS